MTRSSDEDSLFLHRVSSNTFFKSCFFQKMLLSLDDKINIIRSIEAVKDIDVTEEFRLPRTTVNSLWARKKRILENFQSNEVP